MNYYYSNSLGKNGYGAVNIFLAPPIEKINKPTEEERTENPNFGGYDLEDFGNTKPQNYSVTHIVKFLLRTDMKEEQERREDIFTFFVFSPWLQEKNAINQAREYLRKYKASDKLLDRSFDFLSCEKV